MIITKGLLESKNQDETREVLKRMYAILNKLTAKELRELLVAVGIVPSKLKGDMICQLRSKLL